MSTSKFIIHQLLRRVQSLRVKSVVRVLPISAAVVVTLCLLELGAGGEARSLWSSDASVAHAGQQTSGRAKGQKTTQSNQFDVTFITDVPETDIYLQNEKIGTTGKDGQLLRKVPPGEYRATANRPGYYLKHQTIIVKQRPLTVTFVMQPLPVSASPTPTPSATPLPTPTPDEKTLCAAPIERFLNPKTTDQVKQPEWQNLLTCTYQELSRDPSNGGLKAQAEFAQGQLHYLKGNLAGALAAFLNASEASPDYALASYGLAQVYLKREQQQLAIEALRRAVRLKPKLTIAHKLLGDVLRDLKKPEESAAAYAQAYELGYLPPNTNLNSARDLVKSKRCAEVAELVRGLAAEPSSAEGYILLGDCYVEKNERVNAFEAYKDATTRDPDSPLAFYKLATIQFRERKFEAAQAALKRAEELDPNGRVIDHRGRNMVKETEDMRRNLKKRFPTLTVPKP